MKFEVLSAAVCGAAVLGGCATSSPEMMANLHHELSAESFYLPDAEASRILVLPPQAPSPGFPQNRIELRRWK
jgi:hypothetical protein